VSAAKVQGLETVVVLGGDNPYHDQVVAAVRASDRPMVVRQNVEDMAELMAWADAGMTGAGSTIWEMLFMGCPALCLSRTSLQDALFRDLEHKSVLTYLGYEQSIDSDGIARAVESIANSVENRRRASAAGRSLIDGLGCERVVRAMDEAASDVARPRSENAPHHPLP
jgi:spore coat polysaccharide biosynthesis predicted glycosyltransferase SpsG